MHGSYNSGSEGHRQCVEQGSRHVHVRQVYTEQWAEDIPQKNSIASMYIFQLPSPYRGDLGLGVDSIEA